MAIIHETTHFVVETDARRPHVSRQDGGHLVIYPKKRVRNRWEFDIPRAQALMRLSMLVGEAMISALNEQGIPVERLNFQDNGNWGIGTPEGPRFHLHLYGRAKSSVLQKHGEALRFPLRDDFGILPPLETLTEADCRSISERIAVLAREERYQLATWGLKED